LEGRELEGTKEEKGRVRGGKGKSGKGRCLIFLKSRCTQMVCIGTPKVLRLGTSRKSAVHLTKAREKKCIIKALEAQSVFAAYVLDTVYPPPPPCQIHTRVMHFEKENPNSLANAPTTNFSWSASTQVSQS
jgi:hypothetical protein